ncbi:hypothetical protein Ptr902_04336 [Pyrenophora tritici-repentis]|uniref:Uncharacterized protein n=1 Tax=Pyrenophora tritici-repentis TaxID=45151 RepID=A0A5M9LD05_9PLEO|nr:hypothetical protein PtrV1_07107 [Pyrenophora tritici-repentis]KAF7448167.1 hypothetical protein A1F99_075310 [Pyrenophora tritici-repentis]KAF7571878.1 hypothetical protein PtrM4_093780 [Pyrenophora tritici-repentis]KAI0579403.1 hypothetical protein Alg130_07529 [Pyrenophora tritici-repentis]KAI0584553.1 hypothetical protein Alg215_03032 [Pyrenophora tritici-repentis]
MRLQLLLSLIFISAATAVAYPRTGWCRVCCPHSDNRIERCRPSPQCNPCAPITCWT